MRALALLAVLLGGTAAAAPVARGPVPADSRQLLVGVSGGWDSVAVELTLYARGEQGWRRVGEPWRGVLGARGSAWGRGLHGDGAPPGRAGAVKREGDGKSPAGVFALGPSFGRAAAGEATRLPYQRVSDDWICIDDPRSSGYNRVVDRRTVATDFTSAEPMLRRDELYRWVIEVGHNGGGGVGVPVAGGGSCIFLHVWRDAASGTAGCTAMARPKIEALLRALDPAAAPIFVLLPRAEYAALRTAWRLP